MWSLVSEYNQEPEMRWVYYDGKVAVGPSLHSVLLRQITSDQELIANGWLANAPLPKNVPHDIARGFIAPSGHVAFVETNVDRNAVKNTVKRFLNDMGSI